MYLDPAGKKQKQRKKSIDGPHSKVHLIKSWVRESLINVNRIAAVMNSKVMDQMMNKTLILIIGLLCSILNFDDFAMLISFHTSRLHSLGTE